MCSNPLVSFSLSLRPHSSIILFSSISLSIITHSSCLHLQSTQASHSNGSSPWQACAFHLSLCCHHSRQKVCMSWSSAVEFNSTVISWVVYHVNWYWHLGELGGVARRSRREGWQLWASEPARWRHSESVVACMSPMASRKGRSAVARDIINATSDKTPYEVFHNLFTCLAAPSKSRKL